MADQEAIVLEIDNRSVLSVIKEANKAVEGWEKGVVGAGERMQRALERQAELLLKVNDRSRNSMERQVQSIEKMAAAYGKSNIDKAIAERDRFIAKLGGEETLIKRVTAAYDTQIKKMKDLEGAGNSAHGANATGIQKLGLAIKDTFEGRMNYATVEVGKFLGTLGGAALVAGGVAAAILGIGLAGRTAVKDLAEYAVRVREVELRTGLAAREVEQFGFAARAEGHEVAVFERIMRGLTEALTDNSAKGEKARDALKQMGAATRDIHGDLRPTSDILLQISEGLNKIPNAVERDKVAMELFKRTGIETIPVMLELSKNVKIARENGFGPSELEITKWKSYNDRLVLAGEKWEELKRAFKDPLAATVIFTFKAVGDFLKTFGLGGRKESSLTKEVEDEIKKDREFTAIKDAGGQKALSASARDLGSYLKRSGGVEGAEQSLSKLKQKYDEARVSAEQLAESGKVLPEVAKQHRAEVDQARHAYERQKDLVKELGKDEARRVSILEKIRDLLREGQSFLRIGSGPLETIVTNQEIEAANQGKKIASPSLFRRGESNPFIGVGAINSAEQARTQQLKEGLQVIGGQSLFVSPEASREEANQGATQLRKAQFSSGALEAQQDAQVRLAGISAETNATIRLLELRSKPGGELELARQVADVRKSALEAEARITGDTIKLREASNQNEIEHYLKVQEILERQGDEIKHTAEGLYETLLTKPHEFAKQFLDTVKSATLKPITQGLGDLTAKYLQPLIFGQGGEGGIAGKLRGLFPKEKQDPIKIATDLNTTSTDRNTEAINRLTDALAGNRGGPQVQASAARGGIASFAGGFGFLPKAVLSAALAASPGFAGPGGSAIPAGAIDSTIRYAADSGNLTQSFTGGVPGSFQSLGGLLGGPGATSGFSGPVSLGGGSTGGIGGILGGGGGASSSGGGFGGLSGLLSGGLSGIKGLFGSLGGGVFTNPGGGVAAGGGFGTTLGGLGSSPLAGLAGGGLAIDGLTRGGIGGLFETTAGGALLGFKFGGPIGAAIGAAAGAAAGGLRMLFKTGAEQVQQQVKDAYGISISKQMAKQILDISNQRYGGQIHVAIRSKEVLELLSLYSQSTGQAKQFGLLNTARAANLQSQNGSLYQQGTYENGSLIGLQSSLPSLQPFSAVAPIGTGQDRVLGPGVNGPATLHIDSSQVAGFVGNGMNGAASQSYNRLQYASLQLAPETLIR